MFTAYAIIFNAACGGSAPGFIISTILIYIGVWLLYYSRAGYLKSVRLPGALVTGKAAKVLSTVMASAIISVGVITLLSTIFGWGCPGGTHNP